MRKKIKLLVLVLFISNSIFSQIIVSLNAGYSKTRFTTLAEGGDSYRAPNIKLKALFVSYGGLALETGLTMHELRRFYKFDMGGFNPGGMSFSKSKSMFMSLKEICIPIKISFYNEDHLWHLSFGPKLCYLYSAKSFIDSYNDWSYDPFKYNDKKFATKDYDDFSSAFGYSFKDKFRNFNLELSANFGVAFPKYSKFKCMIDYTIDYGITSIESIGKTDNLGREINRFEDYSERTVGKSEPNHKIRGCLSVGLCYYLD